MSYKIEYLPIDKLKINPDNPRLIKDNNFKSLVKSIKDCPNLFDARPCLVSNRTKELIVLAGNMRLLAARELKYKKVPVIIMSGLTKAQEKEILIKDNGTTWGEWDMDLLSVWSDQPLADWGVDLPRDWLKSTPDAKQPTETENINPDIITCPKCHHAFSVLKEKKKP